ncbi:MAG: type I-C CRISPR-associated protein Cas8c/Csd1 [Akkermansia sp.]
MILQELYRLYERLLASGARGVPQMGSSVQKITFCIELSAEGGYAFRDLRRTVELPTGKNGKTKTKLIPTDMLVLGGNKPTGSGLNPCFLFDNVAYLLGCTEAKKSPKEKARAREAFAATRKKYLSLREVGLGAEYEALCRFYETWEPPTDLDALACEPAVREAMKTGNGVFRMQGQMQYLHELPRMGAWWHAQGMEHWLGAPKTEAASMMCLITGQEGSVARVHAPQISGVRDASPMGAALVSFNCNAFESYGKEQGGNSPVSERAAFGYCNALNYLLRSSRQRVQLGDATTVFWTDAPPDSAADWVQMIGFAFDEQPQAQDEAVMDRVRDLMRNIAAGQPVVPPEAEAVRFFLLGLAPNVARLSVRFFLTGTMGDYMRRLAEHYAALRLQPRHEKFKDPELIAPRRLLCETVRDPAKDKIPSNYTEPLMRAILLGRPYPDSLAMAMLRRFKADRNVNYIRCAYLKAWLTRKNPSYQLTPMLDENNTQVGYVLGRLFALLQKTQDDALPNLNRTIRDAYYASASSSPAYVFPRLFKLYNHHVAKLEGGRRVNREKEMQAVTALLGEFPAHLNTEQQGLFALGFYHQTQALFTKKTNPDNQ